MEGGYQNVSVARHESYFDKVGEDDVEGAAVYRCEIQVIGSLFVNIQDIINILKLEK